MMGTSDPQRSMFYNLSLEKFVPEDHPLRRIRPLIDDAEIRRVCRPLQCNLALRWFVGLNLDQDASTFSQNRRRRFDSSGVLEELFDATVRRAIEEKLVSRHVSADGTLVRANASYKSFVPSARRCWRGRSGACAFDRARWERDKGFFSTGLITHLIQQGIEPHIAIDRGRQPAHTAVRLRARGLGYRLSQRCRKKIEELFGEAKDWHGLRRFRRRGLLRVGQETLLVGWILNLKRLATALQPAVAAA